MKQITFDHWLRLTCNHPHPAQAAKDRDVVSTQVVRQQAQLEATHLVMFVNNLLDSSQAGEMSSLFIGPTCTYKTLAELEGKHLGDLPSQRKYPEYYVDLAHLTEGEPWREPWEAPLR